MYFVFDSFLFSENIGVCETVWQNIMVEPDMQQITI